MCDGRAMLLCPHCGSEYLHHDRVDVFEREYDDLTGLHAVVTRHGVAVESDLAGNPSARRQGLTIRLWCEGCHARLMLAVSQHKGVTEVFIQAGPDSPPRRACRCGRESCDPPVG